MMSLPETGRTSSYSERFVMLLDDRFLKKLSAEDAEFWLNVARTVMGPPVITACYHKFQDVLIPRIEHLNQDTVILNPEMLVVSDRSDYKIGPHTDTRARFISLLYYLSPDPKYRSYGTGLYTPKDPAFPVEDRRHYSFEDFNLHSRVDYKSNRVVIFPRTDRSYHGVEPVPVENCDSRLLIVNIRAPEGAR